MNNFLSASLSLLDLLGLDSIILVGFLPFAVLEHSRNRVGHVLIVAIVAAGIAAEMTRHLVQADALGMDTAPHAQIAQHHFLIGFATDIARHEIQAGRTQIVMHVQDSLLGGRAAKAANGQSLFRAWGRGLFVAHFAHWLTLRTAQRQQLAVWSGAATLAARGDGFGQRRYAVGLDHRMGGWQRRLTIDWSDIAFPAQKLVRHCDEAHACQVRSAPRAAVTCKGRLICLSANVARRLVKAIHTQIVVNVFDELVAVTQAHAASLVFFRKTFGALGLSSHIAVEAASLFH